MRGKAEVKDMKLLAPTVNGQSHMLLTGQKGTADADMDLGS
jgi:hypothetical protein